MTGAVSHAPISLHLNRLSNKTAIVTGGGNGFGESLAKRFAQEGCTVIIADIEEDAGQRVASEIAKSSSSDGSPASSHFIRLDCTSLDSWTELLHATIEKAGKVDIIVNNAGTTYPRQSSAGVPVDGFKKMMMVNCDSIFLSAKVLFPYMIEQKRGVMINISSSAGLHAPKGQVLYAGSKAFVNTVTQGLAAEYGEFGIRVNSICPVRGLTRMTETFSGVSDTPAERERFAGLIPMRRMLDHGDIANTAVWLSSDEANFISGVCLPVDGGFACV